MGGLQLGFVLCAGLLWSAPATLVYTDAPRYDPAAVAGHDERFPFGAVLRIVSPDRQRALVPGFAASADPDVSFDGWRILFAGKQSPASQWQIWETTVEGSAPRRVVSVPEDCITPFYLPPDRVVFSRRTGRGYRLWTAPLSGGPPEPLSFGPGDPVVAGVLRDGRVLFEATHASGTRDLFAVYTDGSGVRAFRCDHRGYRSGARELSSGDIVFTAGGRLMRFTSALAIATEDPPTAGEFAGPVAEPDGAEWLVSWRPGPRAPFSLYRWTPSRTAPASLVAANGWQPAIVRPRPRPKIHPSALGNRETGNVLCLNVYAGSQPVAAGSAARVRVWAQDDAGAAVSLGSAPIESDGSFYASVPGDRPVRFELLDRAGATVAAEKGWSWLRKGEQRVCVGCHAGPERSAENAVPLALRNPEPTKFAYPPLPATGGRP